jgi:hypothetical protein
MSPDPLFSQSHLLIFLGLMVPIMTTMLLIWADNRREGRRTQAQSQERHTENQTRLTAIETQLTPIASWFNNGRSRERS